MDIIKPHKIDFVNDKFIVIGAGITGRSIVSYLNYKNATIVRIVDTRDDLVKPDSFANLELITGKLEYENLCAANVLVLSPGVSIYDPVIKQCQANGIYVIGDIELFALAIMDYPSKIIAITGSNGKTTVTTLVNHLINSANLSCVAIGNIGFPALDCYLSMVTTNNIYEVIVLELSSFQLETTYSLNCDVATVLNISEDHLDRYPNLLTYAYIKSQIFNNAKLQIINYDDNLIKAMISPDKSQTYFSLNQPIDFYIHTQANNSYLYYKNQQVYACDQLLLFGRHNYLNVLASLACVKGLDLNLDKITPALASFKGLDHRMQYITTHNNIIFIDDSKGTNVGAVVAGISGLNMPVHLILGGDAKGQDFSPLVEVVKQKCHSVAIIGKDSQLIYTTLLSSGIPLVCYSSLNLAVKGCIDKAIPGECIILSPGCSSLDMFDNYIHRAKIFIESVYAYI